MKLSVIKYRKVWYTISGVLVLGSIVSLMVIGMKLGIDFTGGTLQEVQFNSAPEQAQVVEIVSRVERGEITASAPVEGEPELTVESDSGTAVVAVEGEEVLEDTAPVVDLTERDENGRVVVGTPIIQKSGESALILRMKYIDDPTRQAILEGLKEANGGEAVEELRFETIGPVIGETLKRNALLSIAAAVLFIILFVAYAFRKVPRTLSSWRFGIVAVFALVHDILFTLGIFVWLGYFVNVEIDTLFVTALLTVMGFSVHDTIVVFDRIRENVLHGDRHKEFPETVNNAINQTMARSINTSVTTLITLTALYIFGGASIRWFILALIIGIFIGTYSSIFFASPLIVDWRKSKK